MPALTGKTPGNGTGTLSYKIPGSGLDVEAVYAAIDTTGASGAVTAELTITDQSGVVIARKVQKTTIDQGVAGSATWALQLDDEADSGGGTDPLAVHYDTSPQTGTFLESTTTDNLTLENSGSGQVNISSDDGAGGGGFVGITTGDGEVFIGSTEIVERIGSGGTYQLQRSGAAVVISIDNNGAVTIRLGSAQQLNIFGPFSKKILRITDGAGGAATYEIQTGEVWQSTL